MIDRVANAEFIATAKILRITPDEENPNLHNIEIEIVDLFKGKNTPNLKIYSALNSSCAFYTPENTSWLIFAIENQTKILIGLYYYPAEEGYESFIGQFDL